MKIKVGEEIFEVAIADTDYKRSIGLSQLKKLPKGKGLLMKFDSRTNTPIRMSDMNFSLDLVFIKDGKVSKVISADAGAKDVKPPSEYDSVVELNLGEGGKLKVGQEMSSVGVKNDDGTVSMADGGLTVKGVRQVLDADGKNQANLVGGERVFSRKDTAKFYKYAKDKNYKKLGAAIVDAINRQDTQAPEYAKN